MNAPFLDLGLGKPPGETRVVVAMSGGVDSSTAAALVKEAGYDVVGMTMQLYDQGEVLPGQKTCCAGKDIYDARRVADQLGFPHYVLNYENRFKEQVMDDFADTYLRGETPIPCVRCNQTVKFKDMLGQARELGADALVTGHYVQRVAGPGGSELHRAADASKDQSYFLFATTGEQLDFLRFPLGGMDKAETRAHAQRLGLAVADKPESMDICFVPDGNYARIVERLREFLGADPLFRLFRLGPGGSLRIVQRGTHRPELVVVLGRGGKIAIPRDQPVATQAAQQRLRRVRLIGTERDAVPATAQREAVDVVELARVSAKRLLGLVQARLGLDLDIDKFLCIRLGECVARDHESGRARHQK